MSSLGSPSTLFLAKKEAYEVERSLRFNDNDSAYLTRTPSSTGTRTKWTWSGWIKRSNLGSSGYQTFYAAKNPSDNTYDYIAFDMSTQKLEFGSGASVYRKTTQVFRDVSAWYHLVVNTDTTLSTAADRIKIYLNGIEITSFSTSNNPSQNAEWYTNAQSFHILGSGYPGGSYGQFFDGYMAEINFIDGFQYDPSYFGKTDALTGQWNPKKYGGGYGTNGFYLNFSDNSGTTATTLGKDYSGNGNNFTPNNFSVSAGAGNDSLEDTPTNNFATINGVFKVDGFDGTRTLSEGNLAISGSTNDSSGDFMQAATIPFPLTGKWYVEANVTTLGTSGGNEGGPLIGIMDIPYIHSDPKAKVIRADGKVATTGNAGGAGNSEFTSSFGGSISQGDVWQLAYDADNRYVYFGKNNSWANGSGSYNQSNFSNAQAYATQPTAGVQQVYIFTQPYSSASGVSYQLDFNFGQRAFAHTPPTGYEQLKSANLPDPTILLPNKHFDTLLYTGNATYPRTITGLQFQPDWFWSKTRNQAYGHPIFDSVRGTGSSKGLRVDSTAGEGSSDIAPFIDLTSFNFTSGSDGGFTFAQPSNIDVGNGSSLNFVAWNWNAGNTDGKTYTVKVVSDSGNKYRFDDFGTSAVTLDLAEGGTYIFDQSDSSNVGHPLRFSTTANGTHGGGSEYTTGVTTAGSPGSSGAYTQIVVAASAPTLYYYCSVHSGMGGQANTNSTLGSSNFDGSVQAITKVNTSSGFSIISWTGTGSNLTIGHGLGVKPSAHITKARTGSAGCPWFVYFSILGANSNLRLNTTAAVNSGSGQSDLYNDTEPTSSVITIGDSSCINENGGTYITYAFAEVEGYSKFGKYRGNGSTNGTFVFTDFRPAWVMIKRTDSTSSWQIWDSKRDIHNVTTYRLRADLANAEDTGGVDIDLLANGFKLRNTGINLNGGTYVYFAFAEAPFKNTRAR